ncbi:MAG TPA: hypothetical protein VNO20_02835 [Solirubrobacterales bacterium]|nr:hypothetical protein [Solirubrobacterales bacterium]
MDAWKLPLIVAGIAVPIVAGFMLGGAAVGAAVGALAALAILVVAARQKPRGPIRPAPADDLERHVLVVATCAVEDPAAIAAISRAARVDGVHGGEGAELLVLAPTQIGFLDRWASDVEPSRHRAQQRLVTTVAALAKAGVAAEARVGDEDVVQAVEDQLQSFPATDVILVLAGPEEAAAAAEASAELESRLQARFSRVVVGEG